MGMYILIFEVFIIILFGVFVRTDATSTTNMDSIPTAIYFLLAYTLVNFRYKLYDWSTLTNLLLVISITIQYHTLFYMFWLSVFTNNFNDTSSITASNIIVGLQCTLTILITIFQFPGLLNHIQIFVIVMIEVFGFTFNYAICQWGVGGITSGGGFTIFLFAIIFALPIRKIAFDVQSTQEKQRYFTLTLSFIGMVALIILWPYFNSVTAIPDLSLSSIYSTALLREEAFVQTLLCFMSTIPTILGLRILGEKLQFHNYVSTLINTGILISSSACVIIDPFSSLLLGLLGPILTFLYEKYAADVLKNLNFRFDILGIAFFSGVFSSIFAAGRIGRTPELSGNPGQQGGFQMACTVISVLMGGFFGVICGLALKCVRKTQIYQKDNNFWNIALQSLPIYADDVVLRSLYAKQNEQKLKEEHQDSVLRKSYLKSQLKPSSDLGKILKQSVVSGFS